MPADQPPDVSQLIADLAEALWSRAINVEGRVIAQATVWVLLMRRDRVEDPDYGSEPGRVIAVYTDREKLDARVARIAAANRQYPIRQTGTGRWTIGPDEDEGFFGAKPILLYAIEATLTDEIRVTRREPDHG